MTAEHPSARSARTPADLATVTGLFVLGSLLLTGVWVELDRLGVGLAGAFVLALAVLSLRRPPWLADPLVLPRPSRDSPRWMAVLVVATATAPVAAYLSLTIPQEFPFSGDHLHHVESARAALRFWRWRLPGAVGIAVLAYWWAFRRPWRWWPLALGLVLLAWAFFDELPQAMVRYPSALYFLNLPLHTAAAAGMLQPVDASRLTTAASLLAWLLLLRPLVLGRRPDLAVLPLCGLFFFQKDVVYYATSTYLEPWSIVIVFVAVEALFVSDSPPPSVPCLLCGLAALFKEQAILLLPGFWLAAYWPELRVRRWRPALTTAAAAGAPFLLYYALRSARGVYRAWRPVEPALLFAPERVGEFLFRMRVQFGPVGLLVVSGLVLALLTLALRRGRCRRAYASLLAGAAIVVMFFYTDLATAPWTGYTRYHLLAFACLSASLLGLGHASLLRDRPGLAWAAAALIALSNAPGLASSLVLAARPDPARNFIEHYDAPVYYPIRSLFAQATTARALDGVRRVRLVAWETWEFSLVHPTTYPDLAGLFQWEAERLEAGPGLCACRDADVAVVYLPAYWAGLNTRLPKPAAAAAAERRCVSEMAATCGVLISERLGCEIVGAWARGGRPPGAAQR